MAPRGTSDQALPSENASSVEAGMTAEAPTTEKPAEVVCGQSMGQQEPSETLVLAPGSFPRPGVAPRSISNRARPSKDASVEAGRAAEAPTTETSTEVVAGHFVRPGGPGRARADGGDTTAGREAEMMPPW